MCWVLQLVHGNGDAPSTLCCIALKTPKATGQLGVATEVHGHANHTVCFTWHCSTVSHRSRGGRQLVAVEEVHGIGKVLHSS